MKPWIIDAENAFPTDSTVASDEPVVRAAFLDGRRMVYASLSHAVTLTGSCDEGFTFTPPLKIESVRDGHRSDAGQTSYEAVQSGLKIRFLLVPGLLGFPDTAADGQAAVSVSGSFNAWGGTQYGGFTAAPEWKLKWNPANGCYELVVPVGDDPGQVPQAGAEFKFTWDTGEGLQWYPEANVPITLRTTADRSTRTVRILLAEDADVAREYTLHHELLKGSLVHKRGVLDDAAFVYTGHDLGHTYTAAATRFRLWAPTATGVEVLLYRDPEGGTAQAFPLTADRGGTWVTEVAGDRKGSYYTYRLHTGSAQLEVMDPYAVGAGVNGNRALVADLTETNPPGWNAVARPPLDAMTDAIIYEIHVRDLSTHSSTGIRNQGKFLGFTETGTTGPGGVTTGLDHLKELGVTHLHILPAFDYASVDERRNDQFHWGYEPKNFNVPEGSYATEPNGTVRIREFKQMVQTLHQNGLRVVMDVVYNHTLVGVSPFEAIAPHYFYRHDPTGALANGSGTGNETDSERPMMRKYIIDSVLFWAREYKVDGFRFDLMALHDVETMSQVRAALNEVDPSLIVYGEPWTAGASPLDPSRRLQKGNQKGLGIAVFNDNLRNAIKGDNDGASRGFATGGGISTANIQRGVVGAVGYDQWTSDFALQPSESINYVSAHDNLTLWDKIALSNPEDSEADRIRMDLLAQSVVFTSQGVAFMHGGEEFLRTKSGRHNSYNAPDSVNQLDWSRKAHYPHVFRYYQGLVGLRRGHPAFRLRTAEQVKRHLSFLEGLAPNTVAFLLRDHAGGDPWRNILVVYNPNREGVEIRLPAGEWSVAVNDLQVGGSAETVSGQMRIERISMQVLYQL